MPDIFDMFSGNSDDYSKMGGVAFAKVTSIKDPKNLGRVKCTYITKDKDAGGTGWIYCVTPFGGNQYGSFFHPNVNDIVALAYENGDIHRPVVIGSLWVKNAKPPIGVKDGKNQQYRLMTPNKSYVDFSDEKGKERITAATPKKRTVLLDDENQVIEVSDGKNKLLMNSKSGAMEITCDKKLTIKVGSGITITCDGTSGEISVKAKKGISVSSAQISIKASGSAEISANSDMTVSSRGKTKVKGLTTSIN